MRCAYWHPCQFLTRIPSSQLLFFLQQKKSNQKNAARGQCSSSNYYLNLAGRAEPLQTAHRLIACPWRLPFQIEIIIGELWVEGSSRASALPTKHNRWLPHQFVLLLFYYQSFMICLITADRGHLGIFAQVSFASVEENVYRLVCRGRVKLWSE